MGDMGETTDDKSQWINLCGDDGKVRARLNRGTGELVIKDRREYHRWSIPTLLGMPKPMDIILNPC